MAEYSIKVSPEEGSDTEEKILRILPKAIISRQEREIIVQQDSLDPANVRSIFHKAGINATWISL